MKGISYRKNFMSSNKSSNYQSEDAQEKKKQKYKLEKYEKFQSRKKESSINDDESILKGAESQVKQLLSFFLKNIEKEEKENQGDPLFLNTIEKTKKNKNLSLKSFNNSKITRSLFKKKSTENDEEIQKRNSLHVIRNLNNNAINYLKSNSFNIPYNIGKNNINNNNDIFPKSTFNKKYKKSVTKEKNKNEKKFNSNKAVKDIFNNLDSKKSLKKIKDIKRKSTYILNSSPMKKYSLFNEGDNLNKKKGINNIKIKNLKNIHANALKKDKNNKKNIDLNKNIILNKLTADLKGRSKDSYFTNSIRRKHYSDSHNLLKYLRNINDTIFTIFPTRKNTTNLCISRIKLSLNKEISNSDTNKITAKYKSDELIKNKIRKNTVSNDLSSNESTLLNKTAKLYRNNNFKRCQTNFTRIFGGNVDKKELFRANTIFNSLRKQLKKTIIFRPEDFNFSELNDNYEKNATKIKKETNKYSFDKYNPMLNQGKLNENNSDKINNNTLIENSNNEEKKINNKISLKNVINNNELENSISDLNISKQKLLIAKSKIEIYKTPQSEEKYRKLNHKGEVYDSLDDDEEDEILEPNNFYINPNSIPSKLFNGIKLFLSMYSVLRFPLYLASTINFCKNLNSFSLSTAMDILVEIFYIIDFFIGFFKAYYNFDEQLIKKRSLIINNYLETWFILDLLEAIPVYTIIKVKQNNCHYISHNNSNYGEILNNMNYLLVYNKLFKFYKILYSNEELSLLINKLNDLYFIEYITFFMNVFAIFSAFHAGTCMYIFIGRNSYQSWLYYTETNNKSFFDIYVCSFYFLLTSLTSVGYGDIINNSMKERIFQIFLLLIGIIAYSWTVSSFSNYVIKLNEKNVTYEKDIEILNDIKLNNVLLPDTLYDKIKRHLKYKQYYDKNDKNIIFDCLPIGLKNLLIYEMYRPIIKNFIFFKNFENTDFIVKVILAFRPIIAIKNDILVNEGDMIEDLMFVKKGILTVELPINLKNPQKNIHEYLYGDILSIQQGPNVSKIGNSTVLEKLGNFASSNISQTYFLDNGNMNNTNLKGSIIVPGLAIKTRQDMILELQEKEKERIKNTRYLKIIKIRENEHFGDVLMFLEKRCPLRVRVISKKTELFFLRKVDVVNISLNYQNIWRKINKKSVYNFEQTKKLIRKIIELYCSIKGYPFDGSDFEDSSEDSKEKDKNTKPKKIKRSKKKKSRHKRSNSLNCINIDKIKLSEKCNLINKNSLNEYIFKRAKSINNNIPILYNLENYYQYYTFNSNNTSQRINSQLSDSMNRNEKFEKQLLKTYNRQYKYYTGQNKNTNELQPLVSIIKEEPESETTIYQRPSTIKNGFLFKNSTLKNTKSTTKYYHMPTFNKNNEIKNQLQIKEKFEENLSESDNSDSSSNKEEVHSNVMDNLKNTLNNSENSDIKKNKILSKIISSRNNISYNSNDFENSNISLFDKKCINDEMRSNENISIPIRQEKPLLSFKNKFKNLSKKKINNSASENIFTKTNNGKRFRELLNSNISSNNKENNENNESKIEKSIEEIEKPSNILKIHNSFNVLETENSKISFQIKSSYQNINNICNNKYTKNIALQNKLKLFLLEETKNIIPGNNIKTDSSFIKFKTKKKKVNSMFKSDDYSINRLMTYNKKSSSPKKKGNKYKTNIDFEHAAQNNILFDSGRTPKKFLISNKRESIDNAGVIGNKQTMSPVIFSNKKKKENLLSMINFNIQRTNQKLNNPDEFYSMYFQSIIKNDKRLENKGKKRNSASFSRISSDKASKFKNYKIIKKIK